jgi:hypothetical protein
LEYKVELNEKEKMILIRKGLDLISIDVKYGYLHKINIIDLKIVDTVKLDPDINNHYRKCLERRSVSKYEVSKNDIVQNIMNKFEVI